MPVHALIWQQLHEHLPSDSARIELFDPYSAEKSCVGVADDRKGERSSWWWLGHWSRNKGRIGGRRLMRIASVLSTAGVALLGSAIFFQQQALWLGGGGLAMLLAGLFFQASARDKVKVLDVVTERDFAPGHLVVASDRTGEMALDEITCCQFDVPQGCHVTVAFAMVNNLKMVSSVRVVGRGMAFHRQSGDGHLDFDNSGIALIPTTSRVSSPEDVKALFSTKGSERLVVDMVPDGSYQITETNSQESRIVFIRE